LHPIVIDGDTVNCSLRHWAARIDPGSCEMKVTVEVDCTPLEAREFLGLPDVQPMQAAMMDKLQEKMSQNIEKFSPETLMQNWFTFDPKVAERFQEMFVNMAGLGSTGTKKK
jgi:hypothetical protein